MRAYDRALWRGHVFNRRTIAMLEEVERRLGHPLVVFQGSYNSGGVAASAGTHDGGGAVDVWCSAVTPDRLVRVMREVGFAAWHRPAIAGLWGAHVHAIAVADRDMSTGARAQVIDYYADRDGMKGHAADATWKPRPIPVFNYREAMDVNLTDRLPNGGTVGDALAAALRTEKVVKEFKDAEWRRDKAWKAEVRKRLGSLPSKTQAEVTSALGDLLSSDEADDKEASK